MMATHTATQRPLIRRKPDYRRRYSGKSEHTRDSDRIQQMLEQSNFHYERRIENSVFLREEDELSVFRNHLFALEAANATAADGHEAPTLQSRETALGILRSLLRFGIQPEKITLSADGGVALIFVPSDDDRAYLEVTNDGNRSFVCYDLSGSVRVHDLKEADFAEDARSIATLLATNTKVPALAGT